MSAIFISYRHSDSKSLAGNIADELIKYYGRKRVFLDVYNISPGQSIPDAVDKALDTCRVGLFLIGPTWFKAIAEKQRRGDYDYVLNEVTTLLKRKGEGERITIIPISCIESMPPDVAAWLRAVPRTEVQNILSGEGTAPEFEAWLRKIYEFEANIGHNEAPITQEQENWLQRFPEFRTLLWTTVRQPPDFDRDIELLQEHIKEALPRLMRLQTVLQYHWKLIVSLNVALICTFSAAYISQSTIVVPSCPAENEHCEGIVISPYHGQIPDNNSDVAKISYDEKCQEFTITLSLFSNHATFQVEHYNLSSGMKYFVTSYELHRFGKNHIIISD